MNTREETSKRKALLTSVGSINFRSTLLAGRHTMAEAVDIRFALGPTVAAPTPPSRPAPCRKAIRATKLACHRKDDGDGDDDDEGDAEAAGTPPSSLFSATATAAALAAAASAAVAVLAASMSSRYAGGGGGGGRTKRGGRSKVGSFLPSLLLPPLPLPLPAPCR